MSLMKAGIIETFGPAAPAAGVIPKPEVTDTEVLVRVVAAGLNPIDNNVRLGRSPYARPNVLPAIAGTDMAGIVVAVGNHVERFQAGDRVYGMIGGVGHLPGSIAEFSAVDQSLLAHAPASIPLREAAALPLVTLTAWEGLIDRLRVTNGQKVLVLGGAGGVGHIVVQLAKQRGASVWAASSPSKQHLVASLGATAVGYPTEDVTSFIDATTAGEGFDLVYDTLGGQSLQSAFATARPGGSVASCAAFGNVDMTSASLRGLSVEPIYVLRPLLSGEGRKHQQEILETAAALVDQQQLRPLVDNRCFTLKTIRDAYNALSNGSALVKVVLDVSNE